MDVPAKGRREKATFPNGHDRSDVNAGGTVTILDSVDVAIAAWGDTAAATSIDWERNERLLDWVRWLLVSHVSLLSDVVVE